MALSEYVKDVCKIGQGHDCCRYLLAGPKGFECGRVQIGMRNQIDLRVQRMTAQANNCEGRNPIPEINDEL